MPKRTRAWSPGPRSPNSPVPKRTTHRTASQWSQQNWSNRRTNPHEQKDPDGHWNELPCRLLASAGAPRRRPPPPPPPVPCKTTSSPAGLRIPTSLSSLPPSPSLSPPSTQLGDRFSESVLPVTVPSLARAWLSGCLPACHPTAITTTRSSCGVAQRRSAPHRERWRWGGACLPAVSCRFPHPPAPPKKAHPFSAAQIRLFPDPQAPPLLPRTHARTASPFICSRWAAGRLLSRRRRCCCCWDCSVGGPCSEEGVWRRGDCSRDELRRQQLRRIRYALLPLLIAAPERFLFYLYGVGGLLE